MADLPLPWPVQWTPATTETALAVAAAPAVAAAVDVPTVKSKEVEAKAPASVKSQAELALNDDPQAWAFSESLILAGLDRAEAVSFAKKCIPHDVFTVEDVKLLSREDYVAMGVSIGARNRIMEKMKKHRAMEFMASVRHDYVNVCGQQHNTGKTVRPTRPPDGWDWGAAAPDNDVDHMGRRVGSW